MIRTVYAAVTGEYSDYRVICLFAEKEDAEAYCSVENSLSRPYEDFRVEEFDFYDELPTHAVQHTLLAYVSGGMVTDYFGEAKKEPLHRKLVEWGVTPKHGVEVEERHDEMRHRLGDEPNLVSTLTVTGHDESAVLKTFSDRVTKMLIWDAQRPDAS